MSRLHFNQFQLIHNEVIVLNSIKSSQESGAPQVLRLSRNPRLTAHLSRPAGKPVFYHVILRVVDRRFAFGPEEKEKFRALMRLQEKFTDCRVVSYCLMCNHFHLLLEVPPMAESGLSD